MKNLNLALGTGDTRNSGSSRYSIFSLLTPFALMLTLLASFPSISEGQRIEKNTIRPVSMAAQFNPQEQLTQYQNKEAYLQLWMQFELLRPRLKSPNGQTPASETNDLRTLETDNSQESLVF